MPKLKKILSLKGNGYLSRKGFETDKSSQKLKKPFWASFQSFISIIHPRSCPSIGVGSQSQSVTISTGDVIMLGDLLFSILLHKRCQNCEIARRGKTK